MEKIALRIVPLIFLGYVVAYLDRINVGYAKPQFLQDLKFSEAVYGFGAGLFFFGYFLFEVPSNMLLGARRCPAYSAAYHGALGHHFGSDGICQHAPPILRHAFPS